MAIMAMVMARKISKIQCAALLSLSISPSMVLSGEWSVNPNVGLTETYTNNVELTPDNHQSSMVSQLVAGLDAEFKSRKIDLSISGTETYALYSHNSDLNNDYQAANITGLFTLWNDGPQLLARSSLANISQNNTRNALADLISGDTVQRRSHTAGLQYQTANSDHNFSGSLLYTLANTEDNIGESKGYTANINSSNGSNARNVFWSLGGQYTDRENNRITGTNYNVEAKIGFISSFRINPFIRLYDEDITGTALGANQTTTRSWGPGLRWQVSDHLYIDTSYNYVAKGVSSDDYVATSINWQPSQRTSFVASYNQRFFGESYNLQLSHKTKRLTNTISYSDSLQVFDRDSFQAVEDDFWCEIGDTFDFSTCLPSSLPPTNTDDYVLVPITTFEPVTNNEFTLNKNLAWNSVLALSRTTFTLTVATRKRENLSSNTINDYLDISFNANRKLTPRSSLNFVTSFNKAIYDKDFSLLAPRQKDTYKLASLSYKRNLAPSLSTNLTLQYLERESSLARLTYDEIRAYFTLTKDF